MRNYIYKVLIAVIALIVLFEFTIGKTINKISSQTELVFTKEGRKGMISSIKIEMEKAVKKENYLDEDERILINKFIKKIKDELKSVE
jgi:DNA integrity scanning protein DisA with diadenylate cyclase activity|tara:strand:+ start:527 stop:790 length:264 start_codon:yes stop_codon:yes gene_type:complete